MSQHPRNEAEAWAEMNLPPLPFETQQDYARGPSPWPAVIAIGGVIVIWLLAVFAFS